MASILYKNDSERRVKEQELIKTYKDAMKKIYGNLSGNQITSLSIAAMGSTRSIVASYKNSEFLMGRSRIRDDVSPKRKRERDLRQAEAFKVYESAKSNVFQEVLGLNAQNAEYLLKPREDAMDEFSFQRTDTKFIKQTIDEMVTAHNRLEAMGKGVYFDLETMGDKSSITEFSFLHLEKENGNWDVMGQLERDHSRIHSGIIGITDKEKKHYEELLQRFKRADRTLKDEDIVTLKRLALAGNKNTVIGKMKNGVYNFESFAAAEDITDMSFADIQRGINMYSRVWHEGNKVKDTFSFNGKSFNVTGWEKQLLEGLAPVFGPDKQVLMGHNTLQFDTPRLQRFMESGKLSAEGYAALVHMTGGELLPEYQYDTLAAIRASGITQNPEYLSKVKRIDENGNVSYEDMREHIRKGRLGSNQLETNALRFLGANAYEETGPAHMAVTDTKNGARWTLERHNGVTSWEEMGLERINGTKSRPQGLRNQVFMASAGLGSNLKQYGIWGFREDALSGEYRTIDGFAINSKTGDVNAEIMDQWLFKKNVLYSVDNVSRLNETEKLRREFLGKIDPEMQKRGLYSMTFSVFSQNDNVKNTNNAMSKVTIVGTKDMLQEMLNNNFYHAFDTQGSTNADDFVVTDDTTKEALKIFGLKSASASGTIDASPKAMMAKSDFTALNDSAARNFREYKFKHDSGLVNFIYDKRNSTDAEAFQQQVLDKTREVYKKLLNNPNSELAETDFEGTLFSYAGFDWKNERTGVTNKKLFSETYQNLVNRIEQVENSFDLYHKALSMARGMAVGTSDTEFAPENMQFGKNNYLDGMSDGELRKAKQYYYNIMNNLVDSAMEQDPDFSKARMGMYVGEAKKVYLDLNGFGNIREKKLLGIDLDTTGGTLSHNLLKALGRKTDVSMEEELGIIQSFSNFLVKNGTIDKIEDVNGKLDTPEVAAKRIMDKLRAFKERNFRFGTKDDEDIYTYSVLSSNQKQNFGFSDVDKEVKKAAASSSKVSYLDKDSIDNYVNKVLFGRTIVNPDGSIERVALDEGFLKDDLKNFGYKKSDVDYLVKSWNIRKEDTKKFVSNLFGAIEQNGGHIIIDNESGAIRVQHGNQVRTLENMPIDSYENGRFYTKIGNTKNANMMGIYEDPVTHKLVVGSRITKANRGRNQMSYMLREGHFEGDYFDKLDRIMSQFAKVLRSTTSADKPDAQDLKTQGAFDFDDLVENFGILDLDKVEAGIEKEADREAFKKLRQKMHAGKYNLHEELLIGGNVNGILSVFRDEIHDRLGVDIEQMCTETKHLADHQVQVMTIMDSMEDWTYTKRHINDQVSRALSFSIDDAIYALADPEHSGSKAEALSKFDEKYDIQFGQILHTKARGNAATNRHRRVQDESLHGVWGSDKYLSYDTETTARMNRLAMSTEDFHFVVSNSQRQMSDVVKEKLLTVHLDEGSAVMDPRLIDRIFNTRESEQYVNHNKVAQFKDGKFLDLEHKVNADFKLDIDENGNINGFSYGQGQFVDVGDVALHKNGYEGAVEDFKAKQAGFMRLEIYTQDKHKVKAEDILNLLKTQLEANLIERAKNKKLTQEDVEEAQRTALNILQERNFELKYHISTLFQGTNPKIADEAEKGMYRGMFIGLGSGNEKIRQVLEAGGGNSLLDKVLNIDIVDDLKNRDLSDGENGFKNSLFFKALSGYSKTMDTKIDLDKMQNEIASKFGSVKSFAEAMEEERYSAWTALENVMDEMGVKDASKIHVIDNQIKGEIKHTNLWAPVNRIVNAYYDKEIAKETAGDPDAVKNAMGRVVDILSQERDINGKKKAAIVGLKLSDDGSYIEFGDDVDNDRINSDVLEKLIKGEFGADLKIANDRQQIQGFNFGAGDHFYEVSKVDIKQLGTYDNPRIYEEGNGLNRGVKINHRGITVLEANRLTEKRKELTERALASYGETGKAFFDLMTQNIEDGGVIASAAVENIKRHMLVRPGDSGKEIIRIGKNGEWNLSDKKKDYIVNKLMNDGVGLGDDIGDGLSSKERAERILDSILTSSKDMFDELDGDGNVVKKVTPDAISYSYIRDRYSAQSYLNARDINANINTKSEEEIAAIAKQNGVKVINIEDLVAPRSSANLDLLENALDGNEFILDLHMKSSDKQAYSIPDNGGRYIYMPWQRPRKMGDDDYVHSESQKTASNILQMAQDIRNANVYEDGHGMGETLREQKITRMKELAEQLRDQISREGTSKESVAADLVRAEMTDSTISTAYGHSFKELQKTDSGIAQMHISANGKNLYFHEAEEKLQKALSGAEGKIEEQLAFDYTILSRNAMEKFYTSDNFFNRMGLGGDEAKALREAFRGSVGKYFDEGNVTYSLNIREPQGYFKSTSVNAMSFSNAIQEDEAAIGFVGMESKKGDFDSDKINNILLKEKAVIKYIDDSGKEKSWVQDMDFATFNIFKSLQRQGDGFKIQSVEWTDEGARRMANHQAALIANAGNNTLWAAKQNVIDKIGNDYSLNDGGKLAKKMAEFTLEGKEGGTFAGRLYETSERTQELRDTYDSVANAAAKYKGVESLSDVGGASAQRAAIHDAYTAGALKSFSQDKVYDALKFNLSESMKAVDAQANILKAGAGEMNYNIFGYLRLAQQSSAVDAETMGNIMHAHIAIGEAYLSPKNESDFNNDAATEFSNALNNAYKAMATGQDRETAKANLKELVKQTLAGRANNEGAKTYYMLEDAALRANEDKSAIVDRWAEDYVSLVDKVNTKGMDVKSLDFLLTRGQAEGTRLQMIETSNEVSQQMLRSVSAQSEMQGRNAVAKSVTGPRAVDDALRSTTQDRGMSSSGMDEAMFERIAQRIGKMKAPSSNKGIGALMSLAGGLFVAGVANDPTVAPAETQAAGAEEEQQAQYSNQPISFSDSNINTARGGANQGYLININARSDMQQQHAVNAINSALSAAVPQSSSINISMNTSYRDSISQFQLSKMIANAI